MQTFDPWVGSNYTSNGLHGLRILILGESHYGKKGTESCGFTSGVIRKWGQSSRKRFFSVTQRLVSLDESRGSLPMNKRKEFWENVAFYNFVQTFVGEGSRIRPSAEMWEEAKEPFLKMVEQLEPQVIVVLGKELKNHLPQIPNGICVAFVNHPSGGGFSYEKNQSIVREAINRAYN